MNAAGVFVGCNEKFVELVKNVLDGTEVDTRNSKTKRARNQMITFTETPLVSLRKTAWRSALHEMEWFLSGSNNIKHLHSSVRKWWEPWANKYGQVTNNYSEQFKSFAGLHEDGFQVGTIDQIEYMKNTILNEPNSRRNVITTWNTYEMNCETTPITNCHGTVIQAFVESDELHITMYQRSCDVMLGVPHNWIQYWAFLQYMANQTNKKVGSFTWIGGDCHVYENHFTMAERLVNSISVSYTCNLLYSPTSDEFRTSDFTLDGKYDPLIKENLEMIV